MIAALGRASATSSLRMTAGAASCRPSSSGALSTLSRRTSSHYNTPLSSSLKQSLHTSTRTAFAASPRTKVPTPVPGEHPLEQPIVQRKLPLTKRIWLVGKPGYIKWPVRAIYAVVFSTVTLLGGILIWDATTYRTRYLDGVPVNPLALNPRRGGPKNLKIAEFMVGDEETDVHFFQPLLLHRLGQMLITVYYLHRNYEVYSSNRSSLSLEAAGV